MIGKAQAARQPSIDELLRSIRQAIHERVDPAEPAPPPGAAAGEAARSAEIAGARAGDRPSRDPMADRPDAPAAARSRTIVTSGQEGFAGLLGGDVRLEEALARLHQTGWRPGEPSAKPVPAAASPAPAPAANPTTTPAATPRLRASIDDWMAGTDGRDLAPPPAPQRSTVDPADRPSLPAAAAGHATPPAASGRDEPPQDEPMFDDASCAPRRSVRPASAATGREPPELLSSEAASAASSAFNRLSDAIGARSLAGERSLDEIAREVLRPLLKSWLDANLPGLVERLVREEIERVARPVK